jgi:uncharacterized protein (TIGR00645 family)
MKLKRMELYLENFIFNSRWLLAPFFIGLIIGILLLFVKFWQELIHLIIFATVLSENDMVLGILSLIDITLVSSLILMVIFSGYEIFISKIELPNRPKWMGKVDFGTLKLKLIGAIVAISAIQLLRTFINISNETAEGNLITYKWKTIIHIAFVFTGVVFALMERISIGNKRNE